METAELKTVERMSESFAQPDMQEQSKAWFARVAKEARQGEKEGKYAPREITLKEFEEKPEAERDFYRAVAQGNESEEKSPAKGAAEKDAAEEHNAKESQKPAAKAAEKPAGSESDDSPGEPLSGDLAERHWQGKLQGKEIETHISQVDKRAGIIMKHVSQHPQKAQIEEGFRALFAGRPPAESQAFFRDLTSALAEVGSPAEVFQHITLQPEDRKFLRNVKNGKELRAAIHTIAKHYPAPASKAQPSPKPRAPRPPSEVGGRGAAGDDAWKGMGFGDFATRQSQRYARQGE